ncbi:MAG: hypothetical protein AMJ43_09495 [Coxiella sp. DG_40]|nr:MAG: hypothetical protein AMJ43_09495 [Coxiella sp. DG_40]
MSLEVFDSIVNWISSNFSANDHIDLTFHGGEPLVVGLKWYKRNLLVLHNKFGNNLKLHIQSNLWLLDKDFCMLFKNYGISLGTSLDGPQYINDLQRGEGYYSKTMSGIETARNNGLDVSVICTFTRLSSSHYRKILSFFIAEHLSFSIHTAVSTLFEKSNNRLVMSPDENADLLLNLFDAYMENITRIQISTFDMMARSVSTGKGYICTFTDCIGDYLAFTPDGSIYSCNRFACHPIWRLGSVQETSSFEELCCSKIWQQLRRHELAVHEDCSDCSHFNYCRGGCVYNAMTNNLSQRDPNCKAYKRLFDHITNRALEEVFSKKNIDALVINGPYPNHLMQKGKLLQIMRNGPHPQQVARKAREIVASVALAISDSPMDALCKLEKTGLITNQDLALQSLTTLRSILNMQSQMRLVNAYLHVTYSCNLKCTHCYALSGPDKSQFMTIDKIIQLVYEASEVGFRKVVITGGEPIVHPKRDILLDALSALREQVKPTQIALRTNLAYPLTANLIKRLASSTDQIVVSLDGDEISHDARRGLGSYSLTVANLRKIIAKYSMIDLKITAVLNSEQIDGIEGNSVRALGEELDLPVCFKLVLPLGRGCNQVLKPTFCSSQDNSNEDIVYSERPIATCGLGMNLYIEPGGTCYPCFALMGVQYSLGNVFTNGLKNILKNNDAYRSITVDSNLQCRHCAVRYLCGGFCHAWSVSDNPDDPIKDCTALHKRASSLLINALEVLNVNSDRWLNAGLPL